MPESKFEISPGGPVFGRGKSFLSGNSTISIRQPDGTFKELGFLKPEKLELKDGVEAKEWIMDERKDLHFSCNIPSTPEIIASFRAFLDDCEKKEIGSMVNMIRRFNKKGHFMCRKEHYKHLSRLVHKHYNMNFTSYCRSIGIRYFRGFRVRLESGCWVWKK